MRLPKALYLAGTLLALALFSYGLVAMLLLRFERGDIYPAYSTLRTDPLGCRVLFESLQKLPDFQVERNFSSAGRLYHRPMNSLFVLSATKEQLIESSQDEIAETQAYLQSGGCLLLTFSPNTSVDDPLPAAPKPSDPSINLDDNKKTGASTPPEKDPDAAPNSAQESEEERWERAKYQKARKALGKDVFMEKYQPSLLALWGVGLTRPESKNRDKKDDDEDEQNTDDPPAFGLLRLAQLVPNTHFESPVPWATDTSFLRLDPAWTSIYQVDNRPVLISRAWGKGQIILAADTYFLSNEALRNNHLPHLLTWLLGAPGKLVFDEVHLGTAEQPGVVSFLNRNHLDGFALGLLLIAGLSIWRTAVPLVPAYEAGVSAPTTIAGRDSGTGLVNLLRRNLRPEELPAACLQAWQQSSGGRFKNRAKKIPEMEAIVQAAAQSKKNSDLIDAYQQLCHLSQQNTYDPKP